MRVVRGLRTIAGRASRSSDMPRAVVRQNLPIMATEQEVRFVLRAFYTALLRDGDVDAAARWVSSDFHLRPSPIIGRNYNAVDANETVAAYHAIRDAHANWTTDLVHGGATELLAAVYASRGGLNSRFPFYAWRIEFIDVDERASSAHAVTKDASCGLTFDGRWRVQWIYA